MPRARMLVAAVSLVLALTAGTSVASAADGDIGFEGASYAPTGGSLTSSKPESKLWFNDGRWWAAMYDVSTTSTRIFSLDTATHTWRDTGTPIDTRSAIRSDALWVGASKKLYVATHVFVESATGAAASSAGRLSRYSYSTSTGRYTLDAGFPVTINGAKTETLVIDRDSTGTLWATWAQDSAIYVAHSVGGDDAVWSAPVLIPGAANRALVTSDDISSVIHFGGNRIGIMWSNEDDGNEYFAVHADGAPDSAWTIEQVPTGESSDDHINLKADAAGRVYAAIKTSESAGSSPRAMLMVRSPSGSWSSAVFGTVSNSHTRPIVELDEGSGTVHMIATCPQPPNNSGQSGGDICEKTSPMGNTPAFGPGIGTAIIRNLGSPGLNDATSTKQNLDASTGLVVLANDVDEDRFWHAEVSLGGGPPPPTLTAAFTAAIGATPLDVAFADASTGGATSWSWNFGDATTSTARNPTHRYAAAGTYVVSLTVASGSRSATSTLVVTVTGAGTVTVTPVAGQGIGDALAASSGVPAAAASVAASSRVDVKTTRLSRGRVRFTVTVRPAIASAKLSLLVRSRAGAWHFVRRATATRRNGVTRLSFTVRRSAQAKRFRVVATVPDGGQRSSRVLPIAGRDRASSRRSTRPGARLTASVSQPRRAP